MTDAEREEMARKLSLAADVTEAEVHRLSQRPFEVVDLVAVEQKLAEFRELRRLAAELREPTLHEPQVGDIYADVDSAEYQIRSLTPGLRIRYRSIPDYGEMSALHGADWIKEHHRFLRHEPLVEKPQPCPRCGKDAVLTSVPPYWYRCTMPSCLIGPNADTQEGACRGWNRIKWEEKA